MGFRITFELADLRRAMGFCANIAPANPTIPLIGHVLVSTEANAVRFLATDLGHWIEITVPADVQEHGVAAIPAHRLKGLAQGLPDGAQVSLWQTEKAVEAKSGRSRVNLFTCDASGFPSPPEATADAASFEVPAAELAKMFQTVVHAVNKAADRAYLCGVCLDAVDGRLRAVATDGKVFASRDIALPAGAEAVNRPIIATSTVGHAIRALTIGGDAALTIGGGLFSLNVGEVRLVAKLVDGTYPDYERAVMQQANGEAIEVLTDVAELKRAVDFSLLASADKGENFRIDATDRGWAVRMESGAGGEAEREIECEVTGGTGGFPISPRLLTSALGACSFDTAKARLVLDTRVVVFTPLSGGSGEQHLVMGMRR